MLQGATKKTTKMGVEPKIVGFETPQNGKGENFMVPNPMNKWMIWGGFPHDFWKTPMFVRICSWRNWFSQCSLLGLMMLLVLRINGLVHP